MSEFPLSAFARLGLLVSAFQLCVFSFSAAASPSPFGAGPITPQMFGAIADGAQHPIRQTDLDANKTKWIGKYAAGDEMDYVGLQEAIYACFDNKMTTANGARAQLNKLLYLPPGNYLVNKPPTITQAHGGAIYGAGRFVSTITSSLI